jgi:hypothetical protein
VGDSSRSNSDKGSSVLYNSAVPVRLRHNTGTAFKQQIPVRYRYSTMMNFKWFYSILKLLKIYYSSHEENKFKIKKLEEDVWSPFFKIHGKHLRIRIQHMGSRFGSSISNLYLHIIWFLIHNSNHKKTIR